MHCVTSFGPNGYEKYGEKFLKTYLDHTDIPLTCYVEERNRRYPGGIDYRDLWEVPNVKNWVRDTEPCPDFRWNIHVFVRKALTQIQEMKETAGIFCWLDADIEWKKDFSAQDFKCKFGGNYCAYMGRQNYHPCTSFLGFNCSFPDNESFLRDYESMYMTGEVMKLPEWHDAYVFWEVLKKSSVSRKNLSPFGMPVENVFDKVFPFGHHKKGNLK